MVSAQYWVCSRCGTNVLAHSPMCFECGNGRPSDSHQQAVPMPVQTITTDGSARSWQSVFWFGSDTYVTQYRGTGSTLRAGLAGWYAILCIACPCLIFGIGFAVKVALWPEGEWAGVATVIGGMLLYPIGLFAIFMIVGGLQAVGR